MLFIWLKFMHASKQESIMGERKKGTFSYMRLFMYILVGFLTFFGPVNLSQNGVVSGPFLFA